MKKSDITSVLEEMIRLRAAIGDLEKSQGNRKRYEFGPETEAVRWRSVCLSRALRALTEGDES